MERAKDLGPAYKRPRGPAQLQECQRKRAAGLVLSSPGLCLRYPWHRELHVPHGVQRLLPAPCHYRGHEVTPFVESTTSCSHVVNHGKHCGYHCEDLVSRMEQGEEDLHSEEWILDVVRYGDIFFSLNNRHLWVSLAVSERCQRDDAKNNKTKNWTGSLRTDFSPRYFLPYLRCRATGIDKDGCASSWSPSSLGVRSI